MTERDYGYEAQQAAEARLDLCVAWADYYEDPENNPQPEQPDPSSAPVCGCQTCMIREVLDAAWPLIEEFVRNEVAKIKRFPGVDAFVARNTPPAKETS